MLKQRNSVILSLLILLVLIVSPLCAATTAEQQELLASEMTRVEAGDIQIEQALATAIDQGVSFSLIVEACRQRDIPLSKAIIAARLTGMTTSVTLAHLAEAGVDSQELARVLEQANSSDSSFLYSAITPAGRGEESPANSTLEQGLAYTPAARSMPVVIVPAVTANPGGTAQGSSVSSSGL